MSVNPPIQKQRKRIEQIQFVQNLHRPELSAMLPYQISFKLIYRIITFPCNPYYSSQCPTTSNRQMELFHRFVSLVHDCCIEEREVSFYADKLCISTRYLSAIVRRTTHQSAKELIDKIVIMEIKVLLQNTTLPIQEIAYKMHFPDQSYLGRYFKKHTGISPSAFRQESR